MKRGFLNSKKAKDKPLYDDGASRAYSPAVIAPPKQLSPLGGRAAAIPPSKKKPVGYDFVESIGFTVHPHAVVRFPSLALTKSKEPSSICILRTSSCASITNTPGFYTPFPPQNLTDAVSTKVTPDMGLGLFAKRNFKVSDVILSERPLLVFPVGLPILTNLPKHEMEKYHNSLFGKALQQALGAMTKEDADTFTSLSNCHPNLPQAHGIATTNAFEADIDEGSLKMGQLGYSAIGRLSSRVNHSCAPNVGVEFDVPTFALQIIARRDIEPGQQLFYCYRGLNRSVKERRRELLETYGFVCQCKACVNATPETDKLREEVHDRIIKIFEGKGEMFANPRFNVRSLDPLIKLEKDMVKEGLDFGDYFVMLLFTIFQGYQKLNNTARQREYMTKTAKLSAGTSLDKYLTKM